MAMCLVSSKAAGMNKCVCVCVCVWVGGRMGVYGERRHRSVGGGDIKDTGNRIPSLDKASHRVQRQRKRDPPCDRERHACLPLSGSIQLSPIQLYQAPLPQQELGTN